MFAPTKSGFGLLRDAVSISSTLLLAACMAITFPAIAEERPVIAAASSLNSVLLEISRAFTRETSQQVRVSFGSSGNLTRQIIQGAPFELFLSADENYVAILRAKGLTDGSGEVYALGRLALFIPTDSPLLADPSLQDLAKALDDGRLQRLAIANPEHAPYGRAAREVLQHHHLWRPVQDELLHGQNVAQAAQFALSGNVDAGIISYSIAREPAIADRGVFVLLSDVWHQPLSHHMALIKNAGKVSRSFYTYLRQPNALEMFQKFGFSMPINSQ